MKYMLRLRPYKLSDAKYIVNWLKDEEAFVMWCANKFKYPLTEEQLNEYKGNYEQDENGWLITAINEKGTPVGHVLMRMADYENESIHLGFIIVDPAIRGKGYGKEMLRLVIKYAFEILNVSRITLGVFDNNPAAHYCYKAAGFVDEKYYAEVFPYKDEKWGVYDMVIDKTQE